MKPTLKYTFANIRRTTEPGRHFNSHQLHVKLHFRVTTVPFDPYLISCLWQDFWFITFHAKERKKRKRNSNNVHGALCAWEQHEENLLGCCQTLWGPVTHFTAHNTSGHWQADWRARGQQWRQTGHQPTMWAWVWTKWGTGRGSMGVLESTSVCCRKSVLAFLWGK